MKKLLSFFWLAVFCLVMLSMIVASDQSRLPTGRAQSRDCAIDLMLVIDSSNSIPPGDFVTIQEFASNLVSSFVLGENDARIGIIQFSSSVRMEIGLSDDINAINSAIADMEHLKENTNITGGLTMALEELAGGRSDVPHVIILVTDGEHNVGPGPIPLVESLRAEGSTDETTILGVAVGDIKLNELIAITGGDFNVIQVPDFDGLKQILSILHDYSCAVAVPGTAVQPTPEPVTPTPAPVLPDETAEAAPEATEEVIPTATPSPTPDPAEAEIAFASNRDGDMEIYIMDESGADLRQLTFNEIDDNAPSWSPDGTQIAYESGTGEETELWVMNADGSDPRQLTANEVGDWGPVWSPDGSLIAYHSNESGSTDIWAMNADGTNPRQLTTSPAIDRSPAWSPDGRALVYFSDKSRGREIYIIDLFSGIERRLTTNEFYDGLPNWSPDGRQIAFGSTRPEQDAEIWVMNADGSGEQRLTSRAGTDDDPSWSEDGSHLIFESDTTGNYEIWVMNADGSGLEQLTDDPGMDWSAAWKPGAPMVVVAAPPVDTMPIVTAAPSFATPVPVAGGSVSSTSGSAGTGDPDGPVIPVRSTIEAAPGEVAAAPQGLTAGEIDDNKNFDVYLEYREGYAYYLHEPVSDVDISERHTIRVRTTDRYPVLGAEVTVMNGSTEVTTLHTTATGLTYFFPLAYRSQAATYQVTVTKDGVSASFDLTRDTADVRWDVTLDVPPAQAPVQLDVLILLDTTGSMGDEIAELKNNLRDIASQIDALPATPDVRYGLILYRDYGDTYVTDIHDFTPSLDEFQRNLARASADGGGDDPEAVNEALSWAVNDVSWRGGNTVQMIFLVADAPAHLNESYDYAEDMVNAAAKGIKVFPVASGGLNFQGEYMFRQIAQFTGGRFIFLSSFSSGTESSVGSSDTVQNAYSVAELDSLVVDLVARELAVLFEQ